MSGLTLQCGAALIAAFIAATATPAAAQTPAHPPVDQAPATEAPAPPTPPQDPMPLEPSGSPTITAPLTAPVPEAATDVTVAWEVKNRFRLFKDESDFNRHVAAQAGGVLAAEQRLARDSDGRGWARDTVTRLCMDGAGTLTDTCVRDGVREPYLTPVDHRISVRLTGAVTPGSICAWTFDNGEAAAHTVTKQCNEDVGLRARYGLTTGVTVDITPPADTTRRATGEIAVRDLLIAGLGDSIASGEGNPDRPVALDDWGFCFRTFGGGRGEYYRPGRVGYKGNRACDTTPGGSGSNMAEWSRLSARWMSAACHRSLYGYQLRAALALAVENPQIAVTFLPLACTGATIEAGLFGSQPARELACGPAADASCPRAMPGQIGQLRELATRARRLKPDRTLDLVYLTIGANDINFTGLVADVIIEAGPERTLARRAGVIGSIEDAQLILEHRLPAGFARLRAALKPLVGGNLDKVVYVPYGNPAMSRNGNPCAGSRDGVDIHPAFGLDGARLRATALFVQDRFLPALAALATCTGDIACEADERMSFADGHQAAFLEHGLCSRGEADPEFDRECFSPDGRSFVDSPVEGADDPLACGQPANDFRAYASRLRWVRTANDSYFAAMTFPQGASSMRPSDLHDASWGILSAVYGGAVHPTAEGHAAMADAALAPSRGLLHLDRPVAPAVPPESATPPAPPEPAADDGDRAPH